MLEFSPLLHWWFWTNWKKLTKRIQGGEWNKALFWNYDIYSFGGLAMNKKDRDKVKLREVVHRQLRYWLFNILNLSSDLKLHIFNTGPWWHRQQASTGEGSNKRSHECCLSLCSNLQSNAKFEPKIWHFLHFIARDPVSYIMIWTFTDSQEMGFVSYPVIFFSLPKVMCTCSWWLLVNTSCKILLFGQY